LMLLLGRRSGLLGSQADDSVGLLCCCTSACRRALTLRLEASVRPAPVGCQLALGPGGRFVIGQNALLKQM
jgi:hypothetical protein